MAASITTSTPIELVRIYFGIALGNVESIYWQTDESPQGSGGFTMAGGPPAAGTDHADNLEVLQEIYASTDGFRNDADEAVIADVFSFDYGTTVESLEEFGLWNPLRAGSWEGYQDNLRIQGAASRGLVKHEGSGDTERIEQSIGHVVVKRQASGTTKSVSLERWNVVRLTSTRINFTLAIDTDDNINSISKIDALTPIKAFLAYLESVRSGGSEIGDEILTSSTYTGRQFHIRQQSSDTDDIELTYAGFSTSTDGSGNYDLIELWFNRVSTSAAININALSSLILNAMGTISTTGLMVSPPVGDLNVEIKAREIDLGRHKALISRNNGLFYRGRNPHSDAPFELPLMDGAGLSRDFDSLFFASNIRQAPVEPFVNAVHFNQNSDDVLQLVPISNFVLSPGSHRELRVHHNGNSNTLTIRMWGTAVDNLVTLYPGDSVYFLITLKTNGGAEVVGKIDPDRKMIHSADYQGALGDHGYWQTDEPRNVRLLPFSDSQNEFINEDAFTKHTGAHPTGDQGDFEDESDSWERIGAWTMNMPGTMVVDYQYPLRITAGSTNIGVYNGPRLYRVRGTSNTPVEVTELVKPAVTGSGAVQQYGFLHAIDDVEVGDLYFFVHRYSSGNGFESILMDSFRRSIRINPTIFREV